MSNHMNAFKPGTVCLIIGEDPGCEANIGATVIIVEKLDEDGKTAWTFEKASRPLVMLDGDTNAVLPVKVTHSDDGEGGYYYMLQRHLMPVKGDDVGGEPQEVRKLPSDPATLAWARSVVEKVVAA